MYSVAASTLGCKVNQYDTEAILRDFAALGFTVCNFKEIADVYLINTCTVTNISDKKSRQMINTAYKSNPNALIVAYGCYAQVNPDALKKIEGVSMVIGTEDKERVADMVAAQLHFSSSKTEVATTTKRTRAYLKIQDGCDQFCSYCIVPYARGIPKSRHLAELVSEASELVKNGCKEIVLTGIQIASYGKDFTTNESHLINLINQISALPGLERLRLGSLDPTTINDSFVQALKNTDIFCEHFHLSLQSGSDRVLEKMNRKYTTEEYEIAVDTIGKSFPEASLTTDIIVGFPGESFDDFDKSLAFVERMRFMNLHVFPYSPKKGTKAAEMPNQISENIKKQRSEAMRNLSDKLSQKFYLKYIGKTLPVLFESEANGYWEGHSSQYMLVRAKGQNLTNKILPVNLTHIQNNIAYGEIRKE